VRGKEPRLCTFFSKHATDSELRCRTIGLLIFHKIQRTTIAIALRIQTPVHPVTNQQEKSKRKSTLLKKASPGPFPSKSKQGVKLDATLDETGNKTPPYFVK
jgi:hypothetical protein